MLYIFCDETWTADYVKVNTGYYVFYGVMVNENYLEYLITEINDFKKKNGLINNGKYVEIKWTKVEEEWKNARKLGKKSRYEGILEIFFKNLKNKTLSFGYMFLPKSDYEKIEKSFHEKQPDNKHNFFFMLYFQFLYHCFIRTQVKNNPCGIFIDNHDMGAKGREYNIEKLREILNHKIKKELFPTFQRLLFVELSQKYSDSIHIVDLRESKEHPIIQVSDLCAGCVRYILENHLPPPSPSEQLELFLSASSAYDTNGKGELAKYFYSRIRQIDRYRNINLSEISYHHSFNIFPIQFPQQ